MSQTTETTICDKCGCVYQADKVQCPACANRSIINRIREWIEEQS